MMKITLKSIKHRLHAEWKPWVLKHWRLMKKTIFRTCFLFGTAILGVVLVYGVYHWIGFPKLDNETLRSNITILLLGLPIFYALWVFRTHDVQKQIDKTEENTNNSTFFECARMLAEEKPEEEKSKEGEPAEEKPEGSKDDSFMKREFSLTKTALEQLAYLKKETGFDENRIDSLTRGLDLRGKNFNFAHFNGLDLSKAILNKAILNKAKLNGAELNEAKLNGAKLNRAELNEAELNEAELNEAELNKAKLNGAKLIRAKLIGAKLNDAKLIKADLNGADLSRAKLNFVGDLNFVADLSGAKLNKAILNDAELIGAELNGAALNKAILNKVILIDAKLIKADLREAKLNGADLKEAKLIKADLRGAKLNGADLTGAGTDLTGAIYDDETKFNGTKYESKAMRDKVKMEYRPNKSRIKLILSALIMKIKKCVTKQA